MATDVTNWRVRHGERFAGQRVLVTGGAGFIGSHLCETLSGIGASVVALDDLSGGSRDNVARLPGVELAVASILDVDALAAATAGCRYVFHQAALGSVPRSIREPRRYHEVNVTGTLNVLEAARAAGVGRVMFAASSSAYGNTVELPKREEFPARPLSPYAATKVACEALMSAYSASYGLDTVSLRYFNIFGPRQNANSAYAAVIAAFAKAVVAGGPPVVYGDGEQSRDFTHVDNAVHANLLAAASPSPLGGAVLNVACGRRVTVNELAGRVVEVYGRPDLVPVHEPDRAGDVKHSLAHLGRTRELLGYEPVVDFPVGLAGTLEWYRRVLAA